MQLVPKGASDELQNKVDTATKRQGEIADRATKAIQQFKSATRRKASEIQDHYAQVDTALEKLGRG